MDDRGQLRALLTLRRASEAEARRAFANARRAVDGAQEDLARASAGRDQAAQRHRDALDGARTRGASRGAAGALARAESFIAGQRERCDEAKLRERQAAARLDARTRALETARAALEEAVHRREAAEAEGQRHKSQRARGRARREEAAVDDLGPRSPRR